MPDGLARGPWRQQPSAAPSPNELRVWTPALWDGQPIPARQWIVEGLISVGTVTMLSGDGGQGKSLLAQQLMTSMALGKPWLGYDLRQARTFGLFCEDDRDELQRRQADINRALDCTMADIAEDLFLTSRVNADSYLCRFERWTDAMTPTPLWHALVHQVRESGAQLLVLDTARKTFGGNEISDRQVSQYVCLLRKLAIQIQGAVVFTLHPSNEGIASGSGITGNRAWRNEVRSMMYLTDAGKDADAKPNTRFLRVKKSNYGAAGGKLELKWSRGVFERVMPPKPQDLYQARLADDWPE
jgi:RecA-family ATPase